MKSNALTNSRGIKTVSSILKKNEEDLRLHLEGHLVVDPLPWSRRLVSHDFTRVFYYCPWQTCDSLTYSNTGSMNKTHTMRHVRGHVKSIHFED